MFNFLKSFFAKNKMRSDRYQLLLRTKCIIAKDREYDGSFVIVRYFLGGC